MMTKRRSTKPSAEKTVRDIQRATRRKYSAEEKIWFVMEGLRAEESIAVWGNFCSWITEHQGRKYDDD